MKGISPMIAVVLLIAFTVAIGGLLSVWFSTLTTSQTQTVQADAETVAKCASTSLTVSEVRYLSSGSPKFVNVTITSTGTQNIKNVTFTAIGGGASVTTRTFFNSTGDDLIPGQAFATSINAANISLPPELVIVNGLCLTSSKEASCKSGDPCMKPS